jgi:hypothetical protein
MERMESRVGMLGEMVEVYGEIAGKVDWEVCQPRSGDDLLVFDARSSLILVHLSLVLESFGFFFSLSLEFGIFGKSETDWNLEWLGEIMEVLSFITTTIYPDWIGSEVETPYLEG